MISIEKIFNDMRDYFEFSKMDLLNMLNDVIEENKNLSEEINNYENGYLGTENLMLKDKIKEQDELLDSLTQENSNLDFEVKFLDDSATSLLKENTFLKDRIEQLEIKEKVGINRPLEEDYYNTKTYDNRSLSDALDKLTDERNIYKEVINIMCDKFDISHDSVLNIIDDISQNKSVGIERV